MRTVLLIPAIVFSVLLSTVSETVAQAPVIVSRFDQSLDGWVGLNITGPPAQPYMRFDEGGAPAGGGDPAVYVVAPAKFNVRIADYGSLIFGHQILAPGQGASYYQYRAAFQYGNTVYTWYGPTASGTTAMQHITVPLNRSAFTPGVSDSTWASLVANQVRVYIEMVANAPAGARSDVDALHYVALLPSNMQSFPDVEALAAEWDLLPAAITFRYRCARTENSMAVSAKFYWANGTAPANRLPLNAPVPFYTITALTQPVDQELIIQVPPTALTEAPTGTTHVLAILDDENALFESNEGNNLASLALPDLEMLSASWDVENGGLSLSARLPGPLPSNPVQVGLYWANGVGLNNRLPPNGKPTVSPFLTTSLPTVNMPFTVTIPVGGHEFPLGSAPDATTHLVILLDPNNLLAESNEENNAISLKDVELVIQNPAEQAYVTFSRSVIKQPLRYAGLEYGYVVDGGVKRTAAIQAGIMFRQLIKVKYDNKPDAISKYGANGQLVINYFYQQTANLPNQSQALANSGNIINGMAAIIQGLMDLPPPEGPKYVSNHLRNDPNLEIVDVADNVMPWAAKVRFFDCAQALERTGLVEELLHPFDFYLDFAFTPPKLVKGGNYDPVFHFEIRNPQAQSQLLTGDAFTSEAKLSVPREAAPMFAGADVANLLPNQAVTVSGSVSTGTFEHSFAASQGEIAFIDAVVVATRQGTDYNDNDTVLYLLNAENQIVAFNDDDDDGRLESSIDGFFIPTSGTYKVVVVTFGNSPLLDENDRVIGWQQTGKGDVDFSLTISFVQQLTTPQITTRPDGQLELQWTKGVLQFATDLSGPWDDVEGATSPWVISPAGLPKIFYRVRQP